MAYTVLGLLLTWPMAAHFATHVPGDGIDDPSLAWNLWWAKHAFVDQPQNPFISAWQFWPVDINLAFYTLTILNGLLSIPLQAAFGLVPAYNCLLLLSFVLSGFGAYLLCLDLLGRADKETKKQFGAFLGGALYAFASAKLFYAALGQGNIVSSQWMPFAALYLLRAARPAGRMRDAAMAAFFLVLQAYAELTYASFLLIFAALVAIWAIAARLRARRRRSVVGAPGSLIARFLVIGLLFVLGILPVLANMLPDMRAEGDFFASGGGFADLFSADLAGYTLPTQLHPVLGGLVRGLANDSAPRADGSQFPVNKGQQIYVGYAAMVLALVAVWRGRGGVTPPARAELWLWVAAALIFFVLTLGPSLRVVGYDLHVPLPFALVARLPFFEGNRYPSRYAVMLLLCLAPLVAIGAWFVDSRLWVAGNAVHSTQDASRFLRYGRWTVFGVLLGVLLFEHLSAPLPLSDLRVPALYDRVAAERGDFAVLEVPLGWRNGARVAGKKDAVIMQELWYQSRHGKRLLGGNTSRNPEFKFQYFSEDPTLALLIALTNAADVPQHTALRAVLASRPITESTQAQARDLAAFLNLRYVMVHRDKIPPETEAAVLALLPLRLVGQVDSLALYEITGNLPRPRSYAVGDDSGRMVLAEGWSPPGGTSSLEGVGQVTLAGDRNRVYAQRPEVRLLLPLGPEATQLRLYIQALMPDQSLTVTVDGHELGSRVVPDRLEWLALDVPADANRPLLSDVRLRFSRLVPVAQIGQGPWAVGQTGAKVPVSLLVRSAGEETGDFAHIYVNGHDLALNRRGYNLVALDPGDGRLLDSAAFDTHGDAGASSRLADWIARLPTGDHGAIVAGAVSDEASMSLTEDAVAALRSLGVATDLRGHFRWGHAFVGAAGAPAATALEALDGIRPAQVSAGFPVSAPQVAAALVEVAVGN